MRLKKNFILCLISLILLPAFILGMIQLSAYGQAAPKEPFEVDISCGYDGYGKRNTYIPIHLTVTNHGEDFVGEALIIFDGDNYKERVAYSKSFLIASDETRQISMCVPENGMSSTFSIFINNEDGNTLYTRKVRSQLWYTNDIFVGVLTDDFNGLNYMEGMPFYIDTYNEYVDTRLYALNEKTLADTASALELLDIIVINNYDTSLLSKDQYNALKIWVSNGGILLVGTGADYSKTLNLFKDDYLTGSIGKLSESQSDFGLDDFIGAKRIVPMTYTEEIIEDAEYEEPDTEPAEIHTEITVTETTAAPPFQSNTEEIKTEAEVVLGDVKSILINTVGLKLNDGTYYENFLCHSVHKGAGTVLVFEFDLAETTFSQWDMSTYAIQNILQNATLLRIRGTDQSETFNYWYIEEMLTNFIGKYLPGIGRYVVILLIYILLVSPLMYLVLKRLDKRQLFWGIVPTCALVFTLLMFLLGNNTRQKEPYMNYSTILNTDHEQGIEKVYFSVISPKNSRYQFSVDDSYTLSPVLNNYYNSGYGTEDGDYDICFNYGADKSTIDVKSVRAFDAKYFMAERESKLMDNLEVAISYESDHYSGTITNNTGFAIEDALIYYGSNMLLIGDIPKDGVVTVDENTQLIQNVDYYYISEALYPYEDAEDESTTTRRKMLRGYAYALRDHGYTSQAFKSTYRILGFVQDYPMEVSSISGMEANGNTILSQKFDLEKSKDGKLYVPSILGNSSVQYGDVDIVYYNFWSDEAEFEYNLPQDISVVESLELNRSQLTSSSYPQPTSTEELQYWIYNWQTDSYDEIFKDTVSFENFDTEVYSPQGKMLIRLEKTVKGTYSSVELPEICLIGRE